MSILSIGLERGEQIGLEKGVSQGKAQSVLELLEEKGIGIKEQHMDCGIEIFDQEKQDTHSGGSGCGCAASMLCAHLLPEIAAGRLRRIVFMATGALLSTTTSMQGESVPGVAHAVVIEHRGGKDV